MLGSQKSGNGSREEAVEWIIRNQRGRRNITKEQRDYLMGKEYGAEKRKQGSNNQYIQKSEKDQSDLFHQGKPTVNTAETVAKRYDTSPGTIKRNEHFARGVDKIAKESLLAKQKILSGDSGLTRTTARGIYKKPKEEVEVIARMGQIPL